MEPKGHAITTAILGAGVYAVTGSAELTAGTIFGGFLIDLDHYADYALVEGQRDLRPGSFLNYYRTHRYERVVLALHSWELFAALGVLAWFVPHPLLLGYLVGATLHMSLDLIFNRAVIRNTIPFYSFWYRARRRFAKERLLDPARLEEEARKYEGKTEERAASGGGIAAGAAATTKAALETAGPAE